MAKKRKNPFENMGTDDLFGNQPIPTSDLKTIGKIMNGVAEDMGVKANETVFGLMVEMVESGVTPDEYAAFYEIARMIGASNGSRSPKSKKTAAPKAMTKSDMKDLLEKTLLIRVQMKGVTKPPMWREVEVPADRKFLDLHDIIQCLVGLDDYHLWQFNHKAFESDLVIGLDNIGGGFGDGPTDNAMETPITVYLSHEGDSLEYVYDFGNDWIFTVTLKKILDKKSEYPVCTGFKSSLNAIEDVAYPWIYAQLREDLENWESYTKKKRKEIASNLGFDSPEDLYDLLQDSVFNLEMVNEHLKSL